MLRVMYQFFGHVLRNLVSVVGICDEFDECLLLFGDFNFFLDTNRKQKASVKVYVRDSVNLEKK